MQINPLKQLYNDFLIILNGSVVKYKCQADEYETLEMKKDADAYIKAYRKEDTFNTYYRYERSIISEIMNTIDESEIDKYYYDKNEIPFEYRNRFLEKQRAYILEKYVEKNNYYRMLNGEPNYEESELDFIYPSYEYLNQYPQVEMNVPIHKMSTTSIGIMESTGYLDELVEKYPTKKYIKYIGSKKIDYITARTALNFSLLYIPSGITESLWNNFSMIYEQCREYFMTCIYIYEYRKIIDYYDNFIAMCIMIMTLQQLIARVIKTTIERDFFDEYCARLLFQSYGVPYNTNMDSGTRTLLLQNLNLLILNKGTNKVIYDISSILGYDRIKIFKYYLAKDQKFDADGIPIVKIKIDEETGEEVLDYEAMYDVYFQKVYLDDIDTYKAVLDTSNRVDYNEVTGDDPYWVDDAALMKEMYETEYNYVESKYMGVSISYRMTQILFENIYLLRMILDKKDEIPKITLDLPKISSDKEISLFDAIVAMCAMTSKQNNLRGEVLTKPSMILHVLGFNFEQDFELIKKEILENPHLDDELTEFFKDSSTYTPDRINTLYHDFVNLYDVIVEKMATTNDIDTYQAYYTLYKSVFITKENQEIFNIGTREKPVYAQTYMEYLHHVNPELYELIEMTSKDEIYEYTNHIAFKMLGIIPDLKYLGIFSDSSSTMEMMLVELVRFFKSYTTDMIGMNIIYIFDMKPENIFKLIDHASYTSNISAGDVLELSYSDHIHSYTITKRDEDRVRLIDKTSLMYIAMNLFDNNKFFSRIDYIHNNLEIKDDFRIVDIVNSIFADLKIESSLFFKEFIQLTVGLKISDVFSLSMKVQNIHKENKYIETMTLFEYAIIGESIKLYEEEKILKKDVIDIFNLLYLKNNMVALYDKITEIQKSLLIKDKSYIFDFLSSLYKRNMSIDKLQWKEEYKISFV